MTYQRLAETEGQEPIVVGATEPGVSLDPAQARDVVHRRLEQLVGGVRLSETGLARLTRRLSARQYAAGELVVKQGVRGDFMGLVARGQVAIYSSPAEQTQRVSGGGRPSVLLLPGSTFGEAMLIDGRPSGSTVRVSTDAQIYVLRRPDYLEVARQRSSRPALQWPDSWRMPTIAALVLLVVSMAVIVYFGMEFLFSPRQQAGQTVTPPTSIQVSTAVQIVAPQRGAVLQLSAVPLVRAVLTEPDFIQAVLQVDGMGQGVKVNREPEIIPWVVEWDWEEASEGSHVLAIQAQGAEGEWAASAPVTVTVVPAGTLAFASNRDGSHAIYTMGTDGRALNRLTPGPGDARQPAWGMDGVLAYVTEPEIGQAEIRQLTVDRAQGKNLFIGREPAWSPAGTRLAYAATVEDVSQVFTAIATGGRPFQVTEEEVFAGQPTWSPDGINLAYVAERDGNWDIWGVALDGGQPRRLTDDPAMDWAPAWSPDGSQLAFVSDRGGNHQIYVMRPDGSGVRALTNLPQGAESPAWSPDGYWLAFVAYTGNGTGVDAREIHLMRADGRDQVRLTYNAFDDSQPDWSRIGRGP